MALFKYTHNEVIRFTLVGGHDIVLSPGKEYNLPEENSYIASLEGQGYLERVEASKPAPKRGRTSTKTQNS